MKSSAFFCLFCASTLVLGSIAGGCRQKVVTAETTPVQNHTKEDMLAAQEIAVRQEKENIEAFCRRSGWDLKKTGSGLYMDIYEKAETKAPGVARGNAVRLRYTLHLLNGQLIASSDEEGLKTFIVGEGDVEAGLTEAVLCMRRGERARILIPSHLAYGFSGNGGSIPPMATLLYDIRIEEVLVPPKKVKPAS